MAEYYFAGSTDLGYKRTINEDYIDALKLSDDCVFVVAADGMGSRETDIHPAQLSCRLVCDEMKRLFNDDPDFLTENAEQLLPIIMRIPNEALGALKAANKEIYSGVGSTLTCCFLTPKRKMYLAHIGNSRLYLIRNKNGSMGIRQLTTDHTAARELLDRNSITEEEYYVHHERNRLTSALGFVTAPQIQVMSANVKENDILLLTTDGIHYAIRPEAMLQIVIGSDNCGKAVENLIYAAKTQEYNDNMSAAVIYVK